MFVVLCDDVVKWVEFDKAEKCLYEHNGELYESLHELLSSFDDKEVALAIHNSVLGYLNRNKPNPPFILDTLHNADGYDLQWALSVAEQETGVKIDYFGVTGVKKFIGCSEYPVNDGSMSSIKVPTK